MTGFHADSYGHGHQRLVQLHGQRLEFAVDSFGGVAQLFFIGGIERL
jgi:hypothetical protein